MVREDIIGGLKSALTRGFSLKDAMISFYNAGYTKEDIEEAARKLQYQIEENKELKELIMQTNNKALSPGGVSLPAEKRHAIHAPKAFAKNLGLMSSRSSASISNKAPSKTAENEEMPVAGFKMLRRAGAEEKPKNKNHASGYKAGTGIRVITIVLVVLLVLLLGIMGAIFIFKNQIIQFFNGLLS